MDTKKNQMTFGERLKKLRIEKDLSQSELGKIIRVGATHIGRYERGESKPTAKYLKILADVLDVSTDYLYDGVEEDAAVADLKDIELVQMFKKIEEFSKENKEHIKALIDAFIQREEFQRVANSKIAS